MKSRTLNTRSAWTVTPVSSSVSRTAAASTVSPTSRTPPGRLHLPLFGSAPRFTRRTSLSRRTMAPTPGTGRFGNSFGKGTVNPRSGPGPSILRPCGGEEIEIVEGPLVQDVTQDFADADVPLHRDLQASPKVRERLRHRRERSRGPAQRFPNVFADVPHAERHDVAGMRLPKNHGRGLSAIPVERLPDREPRRVIAAADARIRRAALESLVVTKHDDLPAQRIPQGVRVPRLDQFVPPRARDHHDEEAVIEADCLVHADLVEERERLHALAEFFPDGVVDGGDRPSRRHELAVLLEAERPDAERALDPRDGRAPAVQVEDRLLRVQVRVGGGALQIWIDLHRADLQAMQRSGRPERLDIVVEDDATVRRGREPRLDVRRGWPGRPPPREVDDPASPVD